MAEEQAVTDTEEEPKLYSETELQQKLAQERELTRNLQFRSDHKEAVNSYKMNFELNHMKRNYNELLLEYEWLMESTETYRTAQQHVEKMKSEAKLHLENSVQELRTAAAQARRKFETFDQEEVDADPEWPDAMMLTHFF